MRKSILLVMLLLFSASSVQSAMAPLNVQQARIDTDGDHNQLILNFDWYRNHFKVGNPHVRTSTYNMPRLDWRHTYDTSIPTRIGLNIGLSAGATETEAGGTEIFERSAFGFSNLGVTLEAALVDDDDMAITAYINQHFPWIHNGLQVANTLRPVNGVNAYGFQTGTEYQFGLGDNLTWYGDVGYRFDSTSAGPTQHSLVYYNEAVWGGDDFGMSLGLLGNTVYTQGIGTDLRLVPGIIMPMGDAQVRVGVPIGLNPTSPDLGIQASVYNTF